MLLRVYPEIIIRKFQLFKMLFTDNSDIKLRLEKKFSERKWAWQASVASQAVAVQRHQLLKSLISKDHSRGLIIPTGQTEKQSGTQPYKKGIELYINWKPPSSPTKNAF